MRVIVLIALGVIGIPLQVVMAAAQTADPMALVESERAFTRDVAANGIRDGFLAHLAEESVVFQAGPVDGRRSYEVRPVTNARLAWDPAYAEISSGDDLGWTTGPWTFRPGEAEPIAAAGHYVSLWRLGKDGLHRVELDIGIVHEPVAEPPTDPDTRVLAGEPVPSGDWVAELEEADRALSAAAVQDLTAAYAGCAEHDLCVYRVGSLPAGGDAAGPWPWNAVRSPGSPSARGCRRRATSVTRTAGPADRRRTRAPIRAATCGSGDGAAPGSGDSRSTSPTFRPRRRRDAAAASRVLASATWIRKRKAPSRSTGPKRPTAAGRSG
jgi:hypothetical protein